MANEHACLVIICAAPQSASSAELAFAERELLRDLSGADIQYLDMPGMSFFPRACRGIDVLAIPDEVTVVFLAHGALLLAPGTLAAALAWSEREQGVGLMLDARVPSLLPVPDYLTLRGFENYAERLSASTALPGPPVDFEPLAFVCRAGALREISDVSSLSVEFVPGTFVHDFGGYHQSDRSEMLRWLPPGCSTVLDVGGGEGRFLELVKAHRGCETHLAEFAEHACASARKRVDRVWQGDFLATDFDRRFDCVSFLDVLEHTPYPSLWLEKARTVLTPGGSVLLSIPNVGHWSVIADLLAGRWDYVPAGIHCVTHLRFFTRRGIERLLDSAGFCCEIIEPMLIPPPDWFVPLNSNAQLVCDHDSMSAYSYHVLARAKA
jgi:SAM-dependent methyltransferase